MLFTVGQRKCSARTRFYSWFNNVNTRDPDLALGGFGSTNTWVQHWGQKKQSHYPTATIFYYYYYYFVCLCDWTLPSPSSWHQKVWVHAVDNVKASQDLFPSTAFSWPGSPAWNNPAAERPAWHWVEGEIVTGQGGRRTAYFGGNAVCSLNLIISEFMA